MIRGRESILHALPLMSALLKASTMLTPMFAVLSIKSAIEEPLQLTTLSTANLDSSPVILASLPA